MMLLKLFRPVAVSFQFKVIFKIFFVSFLIGVIVKIHTIRKNLKRGCTMLKLREESLSSSLCLYFLTSNPILLLHILPYAFRLFTLKESE